MCLAIGHSQLGNLFLESVSKKCWLVQSKSSFLPKLFFHSKFGFLFWFQQLYFLSSSSRQEELYDETFRPLIDSVLMGFNGTIFAYGQTGTGKTYTMEGGYITVKSIHFNTCIQVAIWYKLLAYFVIRQLHILI